MINKRSPLLQASIGLIFLYFVGFLVFQPRNNQEENLSEDSDKMALAAGRMEYELETSKDPATGTIPNERLIKANNIKLARQAERVADPNINLSWIERGPNNVGGRSRSVLFDASDTTDNTVFVGAVGGGLWYSSQFKSADPNWLPVNDFFENIAVTAIAQDPNNAAIIYFGTGEGYYNIDALRGNGIWKSSDGGSTWTQLSSTNNSTFYYVQDIVVEPENSYVFVSTRDGGVQLSKDGGGTWSQVLGSSVGAGGTNRASDLEVSSSGQIFATLGIFSTGSVFKTNTSGSTKGDVGNWTDITPSGSYHRIEMAVAPSNSQILYAVCQDASGNGVNGMFKSTNAGSSWSSITIPNYVGSTDDFSRGQAWYDLICQVDPGDANTVWVGGIDTHRSTDGGNTWSQFSYWYLDPSSPNYIHADHHDIQFLPNTADAAVWATDGGLSYSTNTNAGTPTFQTKNSGYNVTQFYGGGIVSAAGSNNMLAGAQDNGTHSFSASGENNTIQVTGGDGAYSHIDANDSNFQISAYVYNNYWYTNNNWSSYSSVSYSNYGLFINPTDFDDETNILYCADFPGDLTRVVFSPSATPGYLDINELNNGQITALKVDPNVSNRVWVNSKSNSGTWQEILKIDNANASTYAGMNITTYPITGMGKTLTVSCIQVEEGDSNHIVLTSSNYGVNQIWESIDGGSSWQIQDGDLPDMPVRWFVFHPDGGDTAYIATDLGVWYTSDLNGSSTHWVSASNSSLPNVSVRMLQYRASDRTLMAITHGRGVFTATIPDLTVPTDSVLVLGSGTINAGTYAGDSIHASCTIQTDSIVSFIGTRAVVLAPDFTVQAGATFSATVTGVPPVMLQQIPEPIPYEYAFIPPKSDDLSGFQVPINEVGKESIGALRLYPNPVFQEATISWYQPIAQNLTILIMDVNGRAVKYLKQSEFTSSGKQQISFFVNSLQAGTYYVVVSGEDMRMTRAFVKQ